MDISQLKQQLTNKFAKIEQIDNSIFRYLKKAGDSPFAVYYFDITNDIPNTKELLKKYQDRVIGKYYFEGKKSLQWSNYLYFVTNKDTSGNAFVELKDLIEGDRNYARKFVISEQELNEVINPPVIAPATETLHLSVLSVWNKKLVDAGLDDAILGNYDIPARLKLIESSSTPTNIPKEVIRPKFVSNVMPDLHSIELIDYRPFPSKRNFEFGKVNLIVGANGVGKTSLLEAIELFYCGRNRRNPNADSKYKLTAVFANEDVKTVTHVRSLQDFRDRNLAWYGQPEVRTNNLYQSFSQFNFLDTDAAVHLSTDDDINIEDDLSKLLIGPDASKIWKDIERVNDAISSRLRELNPLKIQIRQELDVIETQLNEVKSVQKESDSMSIRLVQMLDRLGWKIQFSSNEDLAEKLIESLSELLPLIQQAGKLIWVEPPLSISELENYCEKNNSIASKAKEDIALLDNMRATQQQLSEVIRKERLVLSVIDEIKQLLDSGLLDRDLNQKELNKSIVGLSNCLGRFAQEEPAVIPEKNMELSLEALYSFEISALIEAQRLLEITNSDYENFTTLRIQSANLAEELRLIASKIINTSNKTDECPLCHTEFKSGELAQHMTLGVDPHMESLGQSLLLEIEKREVEIIRLQHSKSLLEQLQHFCNRAELSTKLSVKTIISKIISLRQSLSSTFDHLKKVDDEIFEMGSNGISIQKLEGLISILNNLGFFVKKVSKDEFLLLEKAIKASESSPDMLEAEIKRFNDLQSAISKNLGTLETKEDIAAVYARLTRQLIATEKFIEKINEFSNQFPWQKQKPLVELQLEGETIKKVAADIKLSINKENSAQSLHADLIKRKDRLEEQLKRINPHLIRLNEAQKSLSDIQKNHSLNGAMSATLAQNRLGIEKIFSHIHSPAEFERLGSNWKTVIRKSDNKEAKLTEISTGQRAAFALSIFMARNAQLSDAPPVILIDDPIAHVDDLNSLSFLDYLREVALKGNRQIFFATANEKLATLFQRKFDFLEENFKRYDLTRITETQGTS